MPIDPSIPLSGNALAPVQLPDFNAMTQTRTAGLENMYKIERQRSEDAAAQAKAQQEALVEALAPAYAAAFKGGGTKEALMAGFSLLPPEIQSAVRPQIDKMLALASDNQRLNALEGTLTTSEPGRAILARIMTPYQSETLGIQRGQNELRSRQLELERMKLEQSAQGPQMTPYQQAQIDLQRQKIDQDKSKGTAEETKVRLANEKRSKDLDLAIAEVETVMKPGGLIDQSTGSKLGNLIDGVVATVGVGTPGYEANAKLAPIADLVLKMVPRFEGPQSNYDVQSYKDAAGNLADPTVPNNVKKAAAAEIVRLFRKYRGQFEYAPGDVGPEGGAGDSGVIDFNSLGD